MKKYIFLLMVGLLGLVSCSPKRLPRVVSEEEFHSAIKIGMTKQAVEDTFGKTYYKESQDHWLYLNPDRPRTIFAFHVYFEDEHVSRVSQVYTD